MKFCTWPAVRFVFVITLASSTVSMAATPCPPPQVNVQNGTSASTPCPTVSAGAYSTNFSLTENPLSEGGKWVDGKAVGLDWNNPQSASGKAYASVLSGASGSRYDDSIAHLSTSFQTFNANQYAQGTVYRASGYTPPAKHEIELHLRFSTSAHDAHGYEIGWGMDGAAGLAYVFLVRWNGALGNYTAIYDPGNGSIRMPTDGDLFYAQIVGNIISVKLNGSLIATVDVSSIGAPIYSSGQPGLGFWPVDGATPANYGWKSYTAGNL